MFKKTATGKKANNKKDELWGPWSVSKSYQIISYYLNSIWDEP